MFRAKFIISVLAITLPNISFAAGFALLEQSAAGVGSGFAGAAAGLGDGSEVYFNPAAMAGISGYKASISSTLIAARAKFNSAADADGITLSGKNDGTREIVALPTAYFVAALDEDLALGFGVNSPFGLSTSYDADWVGRYHATRSELTTINLSPAISYKAWKCECGGMYLALGAAANVYYIDATLENAVDFSKLIGSATQQNDGYAKIKGNDWAVGATLGAQFAYEDNRSTMGLAWHSRVQSTLEGEAKFDLPSAARILQAAGLFTDTNISAGLTLPESLAFGGQHWVSNTEALLYEAQWTRWSRFEELRVKFDSQQPDSVTNEGWNNVWRLSVGGKKLLHDNFTWRGGITYDASPVADSAHRTARIPDADRYWLATGLSYKITNAATLDLSYAHLFVQNSSSDLAASAAGSFKGNWRSGVDIVALGVSAGW